MFNDGQKETERVKKSNIDWILDLGAIFRIARRARFEASVSKKQSKINIITH